MYFDKDRTLSSCYVEPFCYVIEPFGVMLIQEDDNTEFKFVACRKIILRVPLSQINTIQQDFFPMERSFGS